MKRKNLGKDVGDMFKVVAGITEISNRAHRIIKGEKTYSKKPLKFSKSLYATGDVVEGVGRKDRNLVIQGVNKFLDALTIKTDDKGGKKDEGKKDESEA